MSILFDELKKWGNLGIPLKDVGTKIEKLNKSLEENKMSIVVNDNCNMTYDVETKIIDGKEKATAITLKVLLFDGEWYERITKDIL